MNKLVRRTLAATLSGTMVLGCAGTVLADTKTAAGTFSIESYAGSAPSYYKVELPDTETIKNRFTFTADPSNILSNYDSKYAGEQTVYFNVELTPARITANTDLYKKGSDKVEDLTALFSVDPNTEVVSFIGEDCYVWAPATNTSKVKGLGQEIKLDQTNYARYIDVTTSGEAGSYQLDTATVVSSCYTGEYIFDGNIYQYSIGEEADISSGSTGDAEDYGTYSNGVFTFDAGQELYKAVEDGSTGETSYELATIAAGDFSYTAAETGTSNTSDALTIVNKSTFAANVTATVSVGNVDGLTFGSDAELSEGDIYLGLISEEDGDTTNTEALIKADDDDTTASATIKVSLDAANNSPIEYMTTETDAITGGHKYAQYESQYVTYDDVSFKLTGAAKVQEVAEGDDAWTAYVNGLTATPTFTVVYSLEKDGVTTTLAVEDDTVKVTSASSTAVFKITDTEGDTLSTPTVTDLEGNTVASTNYTFVPSTGLLTFKATYIKNIYSSLATEDKVLTLNFGDEKGTVTVTITR
jgi:hypothetical protein